MGRYCLCSSRVFFLANSLLASLLSFMWSANFCSVLGVREAKSAHYRAAMKITG